jgi:hypothetical protein
VGTSPASPPPAPRDPAADAERETQLDARARDLVDRALSGDAGDVVSSAPEAPKPATPQYHPKIPVHIRGETFRHRDAIKQLGGRWDSDAQAWVVTQGVARALKARGLPGLTYSLPRDQVAFYHPELVK